MERLNLFRKKALERLSTPERLDRTLSVTSAKGWLALLTLIAIIAATLLWSFKGEVSSYVTAPGMLIGRGGVLVAAAAARVGAVTGLMHGVNDKVKRGDVLAVLLNKELKERLRAARDLVRERTGTLATFKAAEKAETALMSRNTARQYARLAEMERSARQMLETYRRAYEESIVAKEAIERSRQAFDDARRALFGILRERDELEFAELQRRNRSEARIIEKEASLEAAKREASRLEILIDTHRILAPVSGRIAELKVSVGAVLEAGDSLLSIKTGEETLEALIYVPPEKGKDVAPGMEVLVSPANTTKEEHGYVLGRVGEISDLPASLQGMIATLQNPELARRFSASGPPYAARVILEPDPSTASGFAWTSPKGESRTLSFGTLVNVEIKTEKRAPITLVVPSLKEVLRP